MCKPTIDDEDSLGGGLRTSNVYSISSLVIISPVYVLTRLQAIDGLVFTLALVALGDDRGDLAAGLANTGHGGRAMNRTNAEERFASRTSGRRRERLAQRGCQKLPVSHK